MTEASPAAPQTVKPVVTLFELYGAGASQVGQKVARELALPYHAQAFSSEDLEHGVGAATENAAVLAEVYSVLGGAYGGIDSRDIATTQREKYDLVMQNNRTVLAHANEGGVIVGRNAAVILAERPASLHVLLTGAVEDRVRRAAAEAGITPEQAAARQQLEDDVRARMSVVLYGWDPRLPDRYDLVFNTSRIDPDRVADAILAALHPDSANA